ncbi:MAG TPA: tetratricopeptide repeat protein, partial [Pyrinomonadaceae bacterium]|nr:tetratricopeptide repeat protein [Pyrinomonadaceae bacterium]
GSVEPTVLPDVFETNDYQSFAPTPQTNGKLNLSDGLRLQKELDSIEFYIEQGYDDLAARSLSELEAEFGDQAEITKLRARIGGASQSPTTIIEPEKPLAANAYVPEPATIENNYTLERTDVFENVYAPPAPIVQVPQKPLAEKVESANNFDILGELKSEFAAEEDRTAKTADDYEVHYHTGTAYKEMGLMEKAIGEFQDAINLVERNDGTRRFFQCAVLLGHCFMEKQLPKAAARWLIRSLEVADLTDDEKQAVYYEIGNAYETGGEREKAINYFEQLYAENIDYRNVGERLENLQKNNL